MKCCDIISRHLFVFWQKKKKKAGDDDSDEDDKEMEMLQKHSEQRLAILQGEDSVPEDDIEEASLPILELLANKPPIWMLNIFSNL